MLFVYRKNLFIIWNFLSKDFFEPPRVCRRVFNLREEVENGYEEEVYRRGKRASGTYGTRAWRRVRKRMESDKFDSDKDWMYKRNVKEMGERNGERQRRTKRDDEYGTSTNERIGERESRA
jgi:hypothetical protein